MRENGVCRSAVNSSCAAPVSGCLSQRKEGLCGEQRQHVRGRTPWPEETTEHIPAQSWDLTVELLPKWMCPLVFLFWL